MLAVRASPILEVHKQKIIKMSKQVFFMVYLENERTPTYKHSTLERAETEAKRLSKQYGKKAFVLCSLKSFEIVEFKVEDCRPDVDELPF